MKFTVQTTLGQLLNDERAKTILEKHIPGSTSHPRLPQALHMSLIEISGYPEANLDQAKLQALLQDLNAETEGRPD